MNDLGRAERSYICEDRIQLALETPKERLQDTYLAWVKRHNDIKRNEETDWLSERASILGYESEGTVTPVGLKAWARRARAEARWGAEMAYWAGEVKPPARQGTTQRAAI